MTDRETITIYWDADNYNPCWMIELDAEPPEELEPTYPIYSDHTTLVSAAIRQLGFNIERFKFVVEKPNYFSLQQIESIPNLDTLLKVLEVNLIRERHLERLPNFGHFPILATSDGLVYSFDDTRVLDRENGRWLIRDRSYQVIYMIQNPYRIEYPEFKVPTPRDKQEVLKLCGMALRQVDPINKKGMMTGWMGKPGDFHEFKVMIDNFGEMTYERRDF